VYRTRSLINWAQKLCTYGKKIQDITTFLGYIIWTDNGEQLTYKDFEVTMTNLKSFVAKQVSIAQQQLHNLLLIYEDEDRESITSKFNLRSLKDDLSIGEPSWNFLKHTENSALHGYEDWLLT
jgi:elongation factor P--beta-lysine ligase